jgi:hypothetical protein
MAWPQMHKSQCRNTRYMKKKYQGNMTPSKFKYPVIKTNDYKIDEIPSEEF